MIGRHYCNNIVTLSSTPTTVIYFWFKASFSAEFEIWSRCYFPLQNLLQAAWVSLRNMMWASEQAAAQIQATHELLSFQEVW